MSAKLRKHGCERKTGTGISRPPGGHVRIALSRICIPPHPLQGPAPVKPGKEVAGVGLDGLPEPPGGLLVAAEHGKNDPEVQQVSPGAGIGFAERFVAVGRFGITSEPLEEPCLAGERSGIRRTGLHRPVNGPESILVTAKAFERAAPADQGAPVGRVSFEHPVKAPERLLIVPKMHERLSPAHRRRGIPRIDLEESIKRCCCFRIPREMHQGLSLPVQGKEVIPTGTRHRFKVSQRIAVPAEVFEDVRFHQAGDDVMRLPLKNRVQADPGLVIPAKMDERGAALLQGGDVSGVRLKGALEVRQRLRVPAQVEQRGPPVVQDSLAPGIDLQGFLFQGSPRLVSLKERKVGAAPDPLHPGHRAALKYSVKRPDRICVLAEVEERHATGVPDVDLALVTLQDMVKTLDRPVVAAERIVDQAHGVACCHIIGVGEDDLIEALERLRIPTRTEEERALVVQGGGVSGIGGGDRPVTVGSLLEAAEVLERPCFAVEGIQVMRVPGKHPVKRGNGPGIIPAVQEGGPLPCEHIGAFRVRPKNSLKADRCFPVGAGPLKGPREFFLQDNVF